MNNNDIYQSFLFEKLSVRGAYIDISAVYQKLISIQKHTAEQENILSQALINSIFLCQNKINHGRAFLQYKDTQTNDLIVAQATSNGYVRAMLKTNNETIDLSYGQLSVFYQPDAVAQHQQSIIEVFDNDLLKSIKHYFSQSEQTDTSLWYFKSPSRIIGIYLQQIPSFETDYIIAKTRLNTIKQDDIFNENFETTLSNLFAEYQLNLSQNVKLKYGCENPVNRFKSAIVTLGKEQADELFNQHETIEITCDFCAKTYSFEQEDVLEILK